MTGSIGIPCVFIHLFVQTHTFSIGEKSNHVGIQSWRCSLVQFTKAGPLVTLDEICRAFLPGYIDWLNFDINRFTSCLFSISNDEPPCLEWLEQAVESFWKRPTLRPPSMEGSIATFDCPSESKASWLSRYGSKLKCKLTLRVCDLEELYPFMCYPFTWVDKLIINDNYL